MKFTTRAVQTLLSTAILALSAAAASLPDGNYVIYNRVLDGSGQQLAITFQGDGEYVTAEPLVTSAQQTWELSLFTDQQYTITPTSDTSLQAGWGAGAVVTIPGGLLVWTFTEDADGWSIQDGGQTVFWGLPTATDGANVSISGGTGAYTQNWIIEQA